MTKVIFGIFCLPIAQGECDMGADLERFSANHLPYESVAPKRCKHIYFSELDSVQEFSLQEMYSYFFFKYKSDNVCFTGLGVEPFKLVPC